MAKKQVNISSQFWWTLVYLAAFHFSIFCQCTMFFLRQIYG